ncbi:MAG: hypothetical protein IT453_20765, partial [Planctomycetes bacterium]|nr:hypothetical protein [Planctomycetota bacterium]
MRTLLLAVLSLSTPAFAGTYIVDAAGGGDFTDIAPAIAFASPGDVLLIQPGTYGAFTLDKRLVLLGQGTGPKRVTGLALVENVHTGNCAVLAGLTFESWLAVRNCTRPIVFDRVTSPTGLGIDTVSDLRCYGSSISGGVTPLFWSSVKAAVAVREARAEFVESQIAGFKGLDIYEWGTPGDGGDGVYTAANAHLHFARSSVWGGAAGFDLAGAQGSGDGGTAVSVHALATALISGTSTDMFTGGSDDSWSGSSLSAAGSVRHSAVNFATWYWAPALQTATPDDPTLYFVGVPVPGVTTTFRVAAPPGSLVELRMGRNPIVSDVPGLAEDVLVTPQRKFDLGQVGG